MPYIEDLEPLIAEEEARMRSLDSDMSTIVAFTNKSARNVDVVWLSFSGGMIRYDCLQPEDSVEMQTFVTHPWVFRDSDSGARMYVNKQRVYYPQPWEGAISEAFIHIPVFKLKERCLQVVSKMLRDKNDARELEVPVTLKHDLINYAPVHIDEQVAIG